MVRSIRRQDGISNTMISRCDIGNYRFSSEISENINRVKYLAKWDYGLKKFELPCGANGVAASDIRRASDHPDNGAERWRIWPKDLKRTVTRASSASPGDRHISSKCQARPVQRRCRWFHSKPSSGSENRTPLPSGSRMPLRWIARTISARQQPSGSIPRTALSHASSQDASHASARHDIPATSGATSSLSSP